MRKNAHWTTSTIAKLREWFPVKTWDEIEREFAPHTKRSIQNLAYRLKLKRPRHTKDWLEVAAAHKYRTQFASALAPANGGGIGHWPGLH